MPVPPVPSETPTLPVTLTVANLDELPAAARTLAPLLQGVVALYGDMGAGKTTLVRALMREMGSGDDVSSPTFALVNDYLVPARGVDGSGTGSAAGAHHVYHFDFYRIDSPAEAFDLGYEEYFYSGELCLVEWPEKIAELLPPDTARLHIAVNPDGSRTITVDRP